MENSARSISDGEATRWITGRSFDLTAGELNADPGVAPMREHIVLTELGGFFAQIHGDRKNFLRVAKAMGKITPSGLNRLAERFSRAGSSSNSPNITNEFYYDAIQYGMLAFGQRVIQIPFSDLRMQQLFSWIGSLGLRMISDGTRTFHLSFSGSIKVKVTAEALDQTTHRRSLSKEVLLGIFPRKKHPLAGRKANMFLDKLLIDLERLSFKNYLLVVSFIRHVRSGILTDDQMCSIIIYSWSVSHLVPFGTAFAFALACTVNHKLGKSVSDIMKATGSTRSVLGCCATELHTLKGRGVGRTDLVYDAKIRLGHKKHPSVLTVDQDKLRRAIDFLLDIELGDEKVALDDPEEFWAQRFRWCVAGNHSRAANRHWDTTVEYKPPGGRRFTRRICAELQDSCPFATWDATVGVSVGEKIEHAKSRAIYSCDTLSYFAFSWLLSPVEHKWKGKRIILDPGKGGSLGIFNRIESVCRQTSLSCFVMADYADFNSQHSLESQKTLIRALLERVEVSDYVLAEKLVKSFDNMECYKDGWYLGKVNSTLMSGHRATTFINSVLNAAYCVLAWDQQQFSNTPSFHVGDDVVILTKSCNKGWELLDQLVDLGCILQPSKQSVGHHVFEFLRMSGNPNTGARGYVARAIAGLVSGNWVTDVQMEPREGLFSLIMQFRSIINRSGNPHAYKIGLESSSKITGVKTMVLDELLSGKTALYPGPCYRNDGKYVYRSIIEYTGGTCSKKELDTIHRQPLNATYDYITKGLHPVERFAVDAAGFAPISSMAIASYGLSRPGEGTDHHSSQIRIVLGERMIAWKQGNINTEEVTTTEVLHGVLACFPVAQLLKNSLSAAAVQQMLQIAGYSGTSPDLYALAWGTEGEGSCIYGVLPYSDAAGIAARFNRGTVIVDRPICM